MFGSSLVLQSLFFLSNYPRTSHQFIVRACNVRGEAALSYFSYLCCRILDILAYIVKVNSSAMNHLYKLGAFEILLWKLVAGDLADTDKASIVAFIRQSHLLQVRRAPDSLGSSNYACKYPYIVNRVWLCFLWF